MEKYSPSEEFLRRKAEEKEKLKLKRGTNIISQWDTEDKFMCYFAYLFSNWKNVASAHPQMDPGQVQSFLWEKWSSSSQTGAKRKKLKKSRKEINTEETVGGSCADMEAVREDNMEVQHVQENINDIGNSSNDCEVIFNSIKDKRIKVGKLTINVLCRNMMNLERWLKIKEALFQLPVRLLTNSTSNI